LLACETPEKIGAAELSCVDGRAGGTTSSLTKGGKGARPEGAGLLMRPGARYLISAAGIPNYGDDFIAAAWLRFIDRRFPRQEVWLDSFAPGVAASLLSPIAPSARFTDTLWALTRGLPEDGEYSDAREIVRDRIRHLGTPRLDIGLTQLRHAASIHILGGGYLNAIWPRNLGLIAAAAEFSRLYGIPAFATGQGLLPAGDPSPELLDDLQQFRYFEARDRASADQFGVRHGLDDAFLGVPFLPAWEGEPPDLVVLLQGDLASDDAHASYRRLIHEFLDANGAVRGEGTAFVEAYPPLDADMWPELRTDYPQAKFLTFQQVWGRGLRGVPGQKWLTSRFHAHLLAASTGASGIAIDVKPDYYGVKHNSLLEVGTGWALISLTTMEPLPEPSAAPDFIATARRYTAEKHRLASRLYPRLAPLRLGSWVAAIWGIVSRLRRRVRRVLGRVRL